ncbi:hypothetical protein, partial [Roseomonas rosulenta]|uniref:hypothetical protein n=1 Tax=Roseomonas rosulenta TaxID=2748667 RepID=UPI0018DEF667
MPFSALGLSALTSANGFTLWHYRTEDLRAEVLAPGYFAPAGAQLLPGDIVIVQASDSTALVPIRGGTIAGGGVTVDGSGSAPSLLRSASLVADIDLDATAVPRAIRLDTVAEVLFEGETLAAGATITGPIAQVTFTLLIPGALWIDLLGPLEICQGTDASCFGDKVVPGGAAGVDDGPRV